MLSIIFKFAVLYILVLAWTSTLQLISPPSWIIKSCDFISISQFVFNNSPFWRFSIVYSNGIFASFTLICFLEFSKINFIFNSASYIILVFILFSFIITGIVSTSSKLKPSISFILIFSLICLTPEIFCLLVIVVICFFSKFNFWVGLYISWIKLICFSSYAQQVTSISISTYIECSSCELGFIIIFLIS